MSGPVLFYIGEVTSPNLVPLISNLGWMLSDRFDIHLLTTEPDAFSEEILRPFGIYGGGHTSSKLGARRALRSYLGVHDPSVLVQLTHPPVHGTVVGLSGKHFDVPTVYRYSGDRFNEYRVAQGREKVIGFVLGNVIGRIPLKLADQFIVLGPRGRNELTARGVDKSRVTELPPSVDADRFHDLEAADPVDVPEGRQVALFVGRLSHLKGIDTLEQAIPAVLGRRSDVQFVLVGAQEQTFNIPDKWNDHVTIVGPVDPERMPAHYRQADLLVHPSLTDGIPRATLEALAAETPALVRNVGDVPSVTDNTFKTVKELVDGICGMEALPVDSIERYTREALQKRYCSFLDRFQ
jgi:glycosyltransferase involved in cell wall biosynthesis